MAVNEIDLGKVGLTGQDVDDIIQRIRAGIPDFTIAMEEPTTVAENQIVLVVEA